MKIFKIYWIWTVRILIVTIFFGIHIFCEWPIASIKKLIIQLVFPNIVFFVIIWLCNSQDIILIMECADCGIKNNYVDKLAWIVAPKWFIIVTSTSFQGRTFYYFEYIFLETERGCWRKFLVIQVVRSVRRKLSKKLWNWIQIILFLVYIIDRVFFLRGWMELLCGKYYNIFLYNK